MDVTPRRMKADERRQQILEAAMVEFSGGGFDSVSVGAIAARAGVSQPYVFRLFGTKKELYVACIDERTRQIRAAFTAAATEATADPLGAMAASYDALLADDPEALRCQLQAWAMTSDPEIAAATRTSYLDVWRDVHRLSGATGEEVREFMAQGMLLTVLAALELPHLYTDPDAPLRDQPQE